jgi:uncharacterized phiE125 gp8 family phage protein
MGLTLVSPATVTLVSMAEVRVACRLLSDDVSQDDQLALILPAAIEAVERWTGMVFGLATWRLSMRRFADMIELPCWPVFEVLSVKYRDIAGALQLLGSEVWEADLGGSPQAVLRAHNAAWPAVKDMVDAVEVEFRAGYDPAEGTPALPAQAKRAVLGMAAELFDMGLAAPMPQGVQDALWALRRF